MSTNPADLVRLSSNLLGDAQARLRELAMASTNIDTINKMLMLRDTIDARQRRIMRANLAVIDKDPAVLQNVAQLTQLTAELATAVQEMKSATRAIRAATKVISTAERLLPLAAIL